MPTHSEKRVLPYKAEQIFKLVKDVKHYPEFLPWVAGARIEQEEENQKIAELIVKFKGFTEKYKSRVSWNQPGMDKGKDEWGIYVDLIEGPFTHLENRWVIHPNGENECEVEFFVDFAFKSKILDKMIGGLFDKAVHKMVSAFEERAKELYS